VRRTSPRYLPTPGFTLVELIVVLIIVVILACFLFPNVRTAREASRRNACLNNLKQLSIALQNYHDTRMALPLASTAPLVQADGIQQYGAVGTPSPSAESPTNWSAGQQGDGYSWLAQCLPFMEEGDVIRDQTTATEATPVVRLGKLRDAAFSPNSTRNLTADASTTNPYFWSTKISLLVCPSFPGDDDVAPFGKIPTTTGLKVGTGNYVAIAATHYRSDPVNTLESGLPTSAGPNAGGKDCDSGRYCGNGGLPFPSVVKGWVQSRGRQLMDFTAGASHVAIITESREETLTSWYSGLASYVVAAMPAPNGATPGGAQYGTGEPLLWSCRDIPNCETALNRGDPRSGDTTKYYQPASPHGGGPRIWGPSSRHPGTVLHGYADGHAEAINDNIDKDVYLHIVRPDGPQPLTP
jgi:prepilin-type N-terminal cleavage/methylation domain-containing protein